MGLDMYLKASKKMPRASLVSGQQRVCARLW